MNSYSCRVLAVLPAMFVGCSAALFGQDWPEIAFSSPLSGFTSPVHIAHAGDHSGRLFVVELLGRIKIVKNGVIQPTPFLDIVGRTGGKQGLLSVAFPPNFATSRHIYVNYTDTGANLVVSRFTLSSPDVVDAGSEQVLLTIPKPAYDGNLYHSGGELAFGKDGYLYFGIGDGDTGDGDGDRNNVAQNLEELRGKILRLDVEGATLIPPTNPFVSHPTARKEIWAVGVRNPWRSSFDRLTGDYYIADVGQNGFEEIDFEPASSAGGVNYGWRIMEGPSCCYPAGTSSVGLTLPIASYPTNRDSGTCMITGGRVYRGTKYPRLQGIYLYGDFCAGKIWGLRQGGGAETKLLYDNPAYATFALEGLVSFGEDEVGEVYVADRVTGKVWTITDVAPNSPPIARDDSATTKRNKDVTVNVLANDTDPDGGTLTVTGVSTIQNGTAAIVSNGTAVKFTPKSGFTGQGAFVYKISDGQGGSATATANVTVTAK